MSKPVIKQNIVDMALNGKTPNLRGISAETIKNNFDLKQTSSIVNSIRKNKTLLESEKKELNVAFGISMVALGATIVLSFFSRNAAYVAAGVTTVTALVGLDPYFGYKKYELYDNLATDYVLNNRTR